MSRTTTTVVTFRTAPENKLALETRARDKGVTLSDLMDQNTVSWLSGPTMIEPSNHPNEERLKELEDKLSAEKRVKSDLLDEIDRLKSDGGNNRLDLNNPQERRMKVIDDLYKAGERQVHESYLVDHGFSPWFDLGYIRTYIGPYLLKKGMFDEVWKIKKLV